MLISGEAIIELIPQRHPFVMIDKLFFSDAEKTISGFEIKSDCILCANGTLSEGGLVENIAQTAAAGVGYIFKKENTLKNLKGKIALLGGKLEKIAKLKHVGDIRQKGFMVGIELVRDKKTKEPFPIDEKRGIRVTLAAREMGVIIRPLGNVIVLMPPLSISERELAKLVSVTHRAIKEATEGLQGA